MCNTCHNKTILSFIKIIECIIYYSLSLVYFIGIKNGHICLQIGK